MKSSMGIMADDVQKRISEQAAKKEFGCNSVDEWYYICGLWANRILNGTKWSSETQTKKRAELSRLVAAKQPKLLKKQLVDLFTREYTNMSSEFQNDLLDGVFYGILDWKFEDEDESFDGGEAFAFACVDPRHWWEQK